MATYVNNLRLKEIATGAESGTWGTSTNTNLELIGDGLGYGTEQVAADSNETFTMADGTADGVRAMYLKFTSAGSLTATRELTLAPNTVSKVWIIENATTGSQIITIKQGSGGTVNIASGTKKLVYTDGAGSGAAVYAGLDEDSAGADIASATATDLTAATGNAVVITGTTTATSLTMNVGQQMILLPSGAWPLTYHATTMNINGGVSYTCAAGDRIYAVKDLAGVIRVSVFKQDGTALVPGAASSVAVGDITGLATGVATFLATSSSANLASAVTDETGSGALVFGTSPTFVTPVLGTPSSGTLTSATGLPISTGVSGLATGVATFLGTSSSANLASAVTDETGSGSLTFATSPTFVTPALGTPASGTLSGCTVDGTAANTVGFRNIPQNSQSSPYTLVLADAGKHILHPAGDASTRTFTIPANASVAYVIGTAVTFINMTSQVVSIAITSDTMYLSDAGTTGTRSLGQYGSATAIKITATNWVISGSGLT